MNKKFCEGCQTALIYSGRGRPPKYCKSCNPRKKSPECCQQARQLTGEYRCEQHKQYTEEMYSIARRHKYQPSRSTPLIDSPEFGEHEIDVSAKEPWYAGNGAGTIGGQSDDVVVVSDVEISTADLYGQGVLTEHDIRISGGYRITSGDRLDSYQIPDRKLTHTRSGTRHGYDVELEKPSQKLLASEAEAE